MLEPIIKQIAAMLANLPLADGSLLLRMGQMSALALILELLVVMRQHLSKFLSSASTLSLSGQLVYKHCTIVHGQDS